jgi:catechol 2,3-dioxygenase-like lactoylglutathione lyase family enzyme
MRVVETATVRATRSSATTQRSSRSLSCPAPPRGPFQSPSGPLKSPGAVGDPMPATKRTTKRRDGPGFKVLFIAGFGPVVRDPKASRALYVETLGIEFDAMDEYLHTEKIEGAKAFALWPLSQAAQSCFGKEEWPADLPVPQAWLEFDVADVARASEELRRRGYVLLVNNRKEPWGQTVSRLLSPEGLLVGVTHTPWMRKPEE